MNTLTNFVFIDLPEAFIILLAGFAVFNLTHRLEWKKWVLFSVLSAVVTNALTALGIPYQIKILTLFLWMNLLVYRLFRLSPGITVSISTSAFVFVVSAEFFILMLFQALQVNLEQIMHRPILLYFAFWLYLLILVGVSFLMRKFQFDIRRFLPKTNQNRFLVSLVLVGGIEFMLILSLNTSFWVQKYNPEFLSNFIFSLYYALILILFLLLVFLFWKYLSITISHVEVETEKPYLQNIQDLITAIRSIKHDAINHYTALDGFYKVGMHDKAAEYVKHLLREATDLVQIVEDVKSPAVSALLHSKMAICVANHITFTIHISTDSQFDSMKSKDVTTIIGNMLDNAIRATLFESDDNRYIRFDWGETENEHFLTIENSGPTIPPDKQEQIFQLGYTTKTSGEGGVGLAVVKKTIESYNGKITLFSQNNITRFHVTIKK